MTMGKDLQFVGDDSFITLHYRQLVNKGDEENNYNENVYFIIFNSFRKFINKILSWRRLNYI